MMNNSDRIASVSDLIETFAARMGVGMRNEDARTIAGDMICNIMHWAMNQKDKVEAFSAWKSGACHFLMETMIDYDAEEVDELGPDTSINANLECGKEEWFIHSGRDPYCILDDPWKCGNCGETAMDGSDCCITCGATVE